MSLASSSHVTYHADWLLFYNPPLWPPPKPTRYQQLSTFLTEQIDLRYDHPDYVHPVPNLELHSAAASGNLGLVHYALTHGQPVNSVLHGVLPLHAACSGGSVDVVKMLIERGANVNAPRLPRRYSDGRKSNAPSVGTAGSTPLHFAAANGHAPIVQILLACGAVPDKPDKNGMTPEALAEIQGHTEVIRVMRAWESIHPSEPYAASDEGGGSESVEPGSPSVGGDLALSEDGWYDGFAPNPSRKGKERAFSFSSAKSELSVPAVKVKKSLEGFFRRTSRSGSMSNGNNGNATDPASPTPLRISTFSDGSTGTSNPDSAGFYSPFLPSAPTSPMPEGLDQHDEHMLLSPEPGETGGSLTPLTRVTSGDSTILAPPLPPFRASSPSSNRSGGSSTVLAPARPSRSSSAVQDTIDETESNASEYEPALETIDQEGSEGTDPSRRSVESGRPGAVELAEPSVTPQGDEQDQPLHIHHTLPPRHTFSSRRPSLPSILEKAAHPGQAFRNAMRRDRHVSDSTPTIPEDPSQPKSGTFLRGRRHTNDPSPPHSGRRFGTIKGFFRRGNSPPSRSPSPPKQNEIHPDELDERLRRVSLDMSQSEGSSADNRDEITVPPLPQSAPATKTRFFEDLSDNSDLRMAALASLTPKLPPARRDPGPPVRKVSGGVLVPSPLANELRDPENVSLASSNPNIRRSKTEVTGGRTPSPGPYQRTGPSGQTKRRSATLPSQPRGPGYDWDENVNLRRAAASEVIRRNSEKLRQAVEEAADARAGTSTSDEQSGEARATTEAGQEAQDGDLDPESDTPHGSDGEHDEGDDLTPEATPAIEKPEPQMGHVPVPSSPARHRGASIGSFTTDSTRLSTPSVSTNPHLSIVSYDTGSERYHPANRSPTFAPEKIALRAPPNSVVAVSESDVGVDRPRGNTTSSESSGASGMNFSNQPSASTTNTSLTPPSALGNGNSFPPVPEHDEVPGSPRKALTREEAQSLVKQNELDILQLAQLPLSLDSSRSLAAQLAAYGENHQLEQQIAAEERKAKRRAAKGKGKSKVKGTGTGKGKTPGPAVKEDDGSESFVSALSGDDDTHSQSGGSSSGRTTGSSALRMTTVKHDEEGLYRVEAPRSKVPDINNIYDRRAAAYREKLSALTSIKPTVPPSLRSASGHPHPHPHTNPRSQQRSYTLSPTSPTHVRPPHTFMRPRAFSSNSAGRSSQHAYSFTSSAAAAPAGAPESLRHVSSPYPASTSTPLSSSLSVSAGVRPKHHADRSSQNPSKYTLHAATPPGTSTSLRSLSLATATATGTGTRATSVNTPSRRKTHPPPPIADVVNARFSGLPAPPPAPPMSASPYVSIFSSRYSGHPHDGGDSDDSESEPTRYTVIENDWRGGHVVNYELENQSLKRNKWGQFKGAIGHLGRKAS